MMITGAQITTGILAGGRARRLGGVDKGWYTFEGRPLIEHVLERVRPQCAQVVISANRSLARYRSLGVPVCSDSHEDDLEDYPGPLVGIQSVLQAALTPYVMIVPVDTPYLPRDLAITLASAMQTDTELVAVRCESRIQPLHVLMRREVATDLEKTVRAGVRTVGDWQARLARVVVDWPNCRVFANLNTPEDAAHLTAGGEPRG